MGLNLMKKLVENPPRRHLRLSAASESCGSVISTNRLERGERAWFPVGTTSQCYEKDLYPRICEVVQNAGIDRADMYVKFYMIGKSETSAKPTVFICCINKQSRLTATEAVVASLALRTTPKIGLRHAALPLEQPTPARSLASDMVDDFQVKTSSLTSWNGDVFAECLTPTVGRALFRSNELDELSPWSTAGVILRSGRDFYQFTIEHTPDAVPNNSVEDLVDFDLGEVSVVTFDDSDDEDDDDEPDDVDVSMVDHEVLSHASKTPPPSPLNASVISGSNFDEYASSDSRSDSTGSNRSSLPHREADRATSVAQDRLQNFLPIEQEPSQMNLVKVGTIETKASDGPRPDLDYSLISMADSSFGPRNSKPFTNCPNDDDPSLRTPICQSDSLKGEAPVNVFLRRGVTCGVIFAGTTMFKSNDHASFQHLYALRLNDMVMEGDCGATVVNQETGEVYGHIVRGCLGSSIAYAVPFHEVLRDLDSKGFSLSLCHSLSCFSERQLPSHDLTEKVFPAGCSYRDRQRISKSPSSNAQRPPSSADQKLDKTAPWPAVEYGWHEPSHLENDENGAIRLTRDEDLWTKIFRRAEGGYSRSKATKLRRFCSEMSLEGLKSGKPVSSRVVATLNDKGYEKGEYRAREKSFTAVGLFSELFESVSKFRDALLAFLTSSSHQNARANSRTFEEFDLDRRLVLVHSSLLFGNLLPDLFVQFCLRSGWLDSNCSCQHLF